MCDASKKSCFLGLLLFLMSCFLLFFFSGTATTTITTARPKGNYSNGAESKFSSPTVVREDSSQGQQQQQEYHQHPSKEELVSGRSTSPSSSLTTKALAATTENELGAAISKSPTAPPSTIVSPPVRGDGGDQKYRYEKDRMLVPMFFTHGNYHGITQLGKNLGDAIKYFYEPQGNIDLIIFYTRPNDRLKLINKLQLKETDADKFIENLPVRYRTPGKDELFSDEDYQPLSPPLSRLRKYYPDAYEQMRGREDTLNPNEQWWTLWKDENGEVIKRGEVEWFTTPFSSTFKLRLQLTKVPFPEHIRRDPGKLYSDASPPPVSRGQAAATAAAPGGLISEPSLSSSPAPPLASSSPPKKKERWLYCSNKKWPVDYVIGTSWYLYGLMQEPILAQYRYWGKIDPDNYFFRAANKSNLVADMIEHEEKELLLLMQRRKEEDQTEVNQSSKGKEDSSSSSEDAVGKLPPPVLSFIYTDVQLDQWECAKDIHPVLVDYAKKMNITPASEGETWWTSGGKGTEAPRVYYSAFVVHSTAFYLSTPYIKLAKYLFNYEEGFYMHRWTDQAFLKKIYGLFYGPQEEKFAIDKKFLMCNRYSCMKTDNTAAGSKGANGTTATIGGDGVVGCHPDAIFYHEKEKWPPTIYKQCIEDIDAKKKQRNES